MSGGPVVDDVERSIASFAVIDPTARSSDELAAACLAPTRLANVALTHPSRLLAEFQQRGDWSDDGAVSAAT